MFYFSTVIKVKQQEISRNQSRNIFKLKISRHCSRARSFRQAKTFMPRRVNCPGCCYFVWLLFFGSSSLDLMYTILKKCIAHSSLLPFMELKIHWAFSFIFPSFWQITNFLLPQIFSVQKLWYWKYRKNHLPHYLSRALHMTISMLGINFKIFIIFRYQG